MQLVKKHISKVWEPTIKHFESQASIYEHLQDYNRYHYYTGVLAGMQLIIMTMGEEGK